MRDAPVIVARSDAESRAALRLYAEEAEEASRYAESQGFWADAEWWLHEAAIARDELALLEEWTT